MKGTLGRPALVETEARSLAAYHANEIMGKIQEWQIGRGFWDYMNYILFARNYTYANLNRMLETFGGKLPGHLQLPMSEAQRLAFLRMNQSIYAHSIGYKWGLAAAVQHQVMGTLPYQNPPGHEFDAMVGIGDDGKPLYVTERQYSQDIDELGYALVRAIAETGYEGLAEGKWGLEHATEFLTVTRNKVKAKLGPGPSFGLEVAGARKVTPDVLARGASRLLPAGTPAAVKIPSRQSGEPFDEYVARIMQEAKVDWRAAVAIAMGAPPIEAKLKPGEQIEEQFRPPALEDIFRGGPFGRP